MKILSLILCFVFPLLANAEAFRGPWSSALGGAGRAGIDSAEAALLNPALLPLVRNYEFEGYYRDGELDPDQHKTDWGLGAADNRSDVLFPGALNYIHLHDANVAGAPADGELWHVAVARRIFDISVGLSGYMLTYNVNGQSYRQFNYNLGTLWMITPDIGVAYVLNNIAKPGSDVPQELRQDLQQGVGFLASIWEIARIRFDITRNEVNNPDQRLVYMAGFENQMSAYGIFRMGYRLDDQNDQRYLTAGIGFNGPRLKLDYTFEKNLEGTSEALHSVDMRIPF